MSYILRRLLLMVPTLFGVTIVSFCVMQMAPGDPMLSKLSADGSQGESGQTREAFLIQKRDLHLDKPLLLNFRGFVDYRQPMLHAAYYRSRSARDVERELAALAAGPQDTAARDRLAFLRGLGIDEFQERLQDGRQHERLARAVLAYLQTFCEDTGEYAVPAAMELLESDALTLQQRIGLIDCLKFMVVEPHKATYSRDALDEETPLVAAVWRTWWERERDKFAPIDPDRLAVLKDQLATMAGEPSRARQMELMQDEYFYDREDMPFFVETLLGDSTLQEKAVASILLKLYVARPLTMDLPYSKGAGPNGDKLDRKPTADAATVDEVAENWLLYYELHAGRYRPGVLRRCFNVIGDTQYAHMVRRLVTFNFGRSALKTKESVSRKIWDAVVVSAPLMLMAQVVVYLVAVPLGILCAVTRGGWIDRLISLKLFVLYSVPPFVAGMIFLLVFCYGDYLKLFPMERLHGDGADQFGWGRYLVDYLWHCVMPVTCLSLFSLAGLAMYARASMLDVLEQDFIRTARAKGVSRFSVVMKHALRNGMIPILTLFSNFLPALLGGSVLIEYLFNIPGMGRLSWESIEQKDFPTLMALVYVQAIVVLLSILLTDVLYVFVDPRISFESREKAA